MDIYMNIRERMMAALEGRDVDRVPVFSFSELIPRGNFERMLRDRGMGLVVHASPVNDENPNVVTTKMKSKIGEKTIYQTPKGCISEENYTNTGRIVAFMHTVKYGSIINDEKDYDTLISMIEDNVVSLDMEEFKLKERELGDDGILHVLVPNPPFTETERLIGLEKWSYEMCDNPEEIERLMEALARRTEKKINMLADVDLKMAIAVGDISDNISPEQYMKYEIPHYEKYFKLLRAKGHKCGIHAHASLLKRQKGVLAAIKPDFIESFTPPPYSDLPLHELREAVGENVTIMINFPEAVFFEGYDKTKEYTLNLLKSDPTNRKMIGFSEMGMMGVNEENREIFETGIKAVMDAVDEL